MTTAPDCRAEVFYSKEEALELAFGADAQWEPQNVFLTDEQQAAIEQAARVKLDSKLYTFFVGKKHDRVLGYAAIESHTVRTQPETLLIVLSPEGEWTRSAILAFHEPPEYKPADRWFEHLYRRAIGELELGRGADGISGATLSCRASLNSVRKVMAIFKVGIREGA